MKYPSKLSVGARMIIGLSLTVLSGLVIAFCGYYGLKKVDDAKSEIVLNSSALRNHLEGNMMYDALALTCLLLCSHPNETSIREFRKQPEMLTCIVSCLQIMICWLAVQPNLQYVMNPSTLYEIENATTFGARIEVGF